MGDIKWIPLEGMSLTAANLAAAEKLRRFGFAVICGEFGSEKLTKAGLCIYDVLAEKDNPNILLITSTRELYGWYRILLTGIGADFKIISGAPNALVFFDKSSPNLCLMSADALSGENALKAKVGADFVWDLIIVDEEQNTGVPDYSFYEKNIPWRSDKLLVTAPFPAKTSEDRDALVSLIKKVMDDETLSAKADMVEFTGAACGLNEDSPVMRYYDTRVYTGEMKRNVEFRSYAFDENALSGLRRHVDLRSGVPSYRYGGNIFEEYDCEEYKRTYRKSVYTRSDVEDLRSFDKKLDSFLSLVGEIMADADSRAVVYCCDKNTMEYLRKVLSCVCKGGGSVATAKGELFRSEDIIRKLRVDDSTVYPKIVLAVDGLGAVGEGLDRINFIVNYELPASAALLERRITRHGSARENERRIIIFRDDNKLFDSRMFDKILYGSVTDGFCGALPSRNILLDIADDDKSAGLNEAIADLRYIRSYASEVDNCTELIKKVKCDYALLGASNVSNSKQLSEFADNRLKKLYAAFGLSDGSTPDDIKNAISALGGLCVMNNERIERVSDETLKKFSDSFSGDGYLSQPFAAEAVKGLSDAKAAIDELHEGNDFHQQVKNQLAAFNDCVQYPVLFGIWRYRVREKGSERSFRDYIRIYNDGI